MTVRGSLRALAAQILAALRTRVELFSVEWQQARSHMAVNIALLLSGMAFLWLAVLMLSFLVITLSWPTPYRNWVVLGLVLIYTVLGLACILILKKRLQDEENHPFSATVQELTQDARLLSEIFDSKDDDDSGQSRG